MMDKDRFFLYDPEGDGFETFPTIEERDAAAEKTIPLYCDDGWLEEVQDVAMGEITHVATEVDRVDRPPDYDLDEDDFDEEGAYWPPGQDHICNYEMLPISKHEGET